MADGVTEAEVRTIAYEVHETLSGDTWPDCHNAAGRIRQRLTNQYGVDDRYVRIREYMLPDEYGHYALYIAPEVLGEGMIVDASFAQFANETDAPISIAPIDDIEPVVLVQPAHRYVFHEYTTS